MLYRRKKNKLICLCIILYNLEQAKQKKKAIKRSVQNSKYKHDVIIYSVFFSSTFDVYIATRILFLFDF
jgi:hypothetical protein